MRQANAPRVSVSDTASAGQQDDSRPRAFVFPPSGTSNRVDAATIDAITGEIQSTGDERKWRYGKQRLESPSIRRNRHFVTLARWEGAVLERFETYFRAELIDLDNDERAVAEFDLRELSPSDVSLCEPGALFYWSIGYDIKESGQRNRASVIRFRRLGTE